MNASVQLPSIAGKLARRPEWLAMAAIACAAFLYSAWVLDGRLFYYSDDWPWLWRAEFSPWQFYFVLLPIDVYNDRPVGAGVIKLLYEAFGLDHSRQALVLLCLHALNCVLLYSIAARYAGRAGALLAGLLSAAWFSTLYAVGALATIFDLLGATLCLATLKLRQLGARAESSTRYDIAGVACYVLAIRTKEFALGLVVVVLLMNLLLERQPLRAASGQSIPYLVVFAIYLARYAQLMASAPPAADNPYHLVLSLGTLAASVDFFVSAAFYENVVGTLGVLAFVAALGVALATAGAEARRVAAFGLAGFVVMLGPTLLLPKTAESEYHQLYLYTPHFFLALVIGAVLVRRVVPAALALVIGLAVAFLPIWSKMQVNVANFYLSKSEVARAQFDAAVRVLKPIERGTSVFIAGVEPYFNPFSNPEGNSLNVAFKDRTIRLVVDKPESELLEGFCAARQPRRFLRFSGVEVSDVTADVSMSCTRVALR